MVSSHDPENGGGAFSGDGGAAGKAELNYPRDIEVGLDGALYVADAGNNRIRVIGDVNVSARRGDVHGVAFTAGVLLALAALGASFLYRRRRGEAAEAGAD